MITTPECPFTITVRLAISGSRIVSEKEIRRVMEPTVWAEAMPRNEAFTGTFNDLER